MAVLRVVLTLLLALFAVQASTAAVAAAAAVCAETCADDGPDGRCAPTCADCVCCDHGTRPLAAVAAPADALAPSLRTLAAGPRLAAPARDPREIFHVPRRDLV
jgi:hypothetical protein